MAMTPGPALWCDECGTITPMGSPHSFDECPHCGGGLTQAVDMSSCGRGDGCEDEYHDFGTGMHVVEVR